VLQTNFQLSDLQDFIMKTFKKLGRVIMKIIHYNYFLNLQKKMSLTEILNIYYLVYEKENSRI
jgi:hypothetical protein